MANGEDFGAALLRRQVGEYTNIKHLDNKLEEDMEYIAFMDASGMAMTYGVLTQEYIKKALKDKRKHIITAIYLYSNWRVWRVYKSDEKLARKYQKICDMIDALIFDEWKGTEQLKYFIRETD